MKISIAGNGVFGTFLQELLASEFDVCDNAESVILAVPLSAYLEVAKNHPKKHLINVCSVQKPSTDILLSVSDRVTSIHPLFGKRTPPDKRNAIMTRTCIQDNDTWYLDECELEFLKGFKKICNVITGFTPEQHDQMMAKTHLAAVIAAEQAKIFIERAKDIPDEFIPHSFRLLRNFVQTLEDMPKGTMESIKANPY